MKKDVKKIIDEIVGEFNGKLKIVIKYAGKKMTSLESENDVELKNITVELETLIIRLGSCLQDAMVTTGITKEQLQSSLPQSKYDHYRTCTSELKIIVYHLGTPMLSTSAEKVLPHQIKEAFDGMTLTIQNHLDNLVRLGKLTPNFNSNKRS